MNTKFTFENLDEAHIEETLLLTDELVGEGLYTREILEESIKNDKHFFKLVFDEEKIVAYFYYIIMTAAEYKDLLTETKPSALLYSLDDDTPICVMQTIGITNSARTCNLSDSLVQSAIAHAEHAQCEYIMVYAWAYGEKIPAQSLLTRNGFAYKETVEKAWENVLTLKCDKCTTSTCSCNAKVFAREL